MCIFLILSYKILLKHSLLSQKLIPLFYTTIQNFLHYKMYIKSADIKQNLDYTVTMNMIDSMLNKPVPTPTPGSILVGKQYATKYDEQIKKMLSSEFIDKEILNEMRNSVKTDLDSIIEDGNRRFYSYHIQQNREMMAMILDFVLSI